MNVLIACDSFKDGLPAMEVCKAIAKGIHLANPAIQTQLLPLADGGEGTAEILTYHTNGQWVQKKVQDPLFREIWANYGLAKDGKTAFIDMAQASGLQLLSPAERNPLYTSTYGTGQLILDAMQQGVEKIVLGIGGSATNDGGMGMARALGYHFKDKKGNRLQGCGADLSKVSVIIPPKVDLPTIEVLCDVTNPLYGPQGAAYSYGRQKGGDDPMLELLDRGLQNLASRVKEQLGVEGAAVAGAGAAGGMGYGAMVFLKASLHSGIGAVMHYTHFAAHVKAADLVITGEGKIDEQTRQGKLISGICQQAMAHNKPVIAFCGALLASPRLVREIGLTAAFSIQTHPTSLEEALLQTAQGLCDVAFHVCKTIDIYPGRHQTF
ncbi:MAG: glycerate kinase [Saprospiraceae bacterium]